MNQPKTAILDSLDTVLRDIRSARQTIERCKILTTARKDKR
jgi:hypothetical protein